MDDDGVIPSHDSEHSGVREGSRRNIVDDRTGGPARPGGHPLTGRGAFKLFVTIFLVAFIILTSLVTSIGLFVFHVLEHGAVGRWDHGVSLWFIDHGSNFWNSATTDVTFAADTVTVAAIAIVATIVLLFRHWGRRAFILATSLAIELSVFISSNTIVARPRPSIRHLGGTPSTYSFPSGHTAAAIALYGGLAIVVSTSTTNHFTRFAAWFLATLLAFAVGLSRIYRGEHYATDVLAGALVGIGALCAAVIIMRMVAAPAKQIDDPEPPSSDVKIEPKSEVPT